jgi:AbrB family looped-hinge helix DNA binding protein
MPTATLTSKGQTTIPKEVRDRLKLKPGDRLEFILQGDGQVLMVPASVRAAELRGILPRPKKRVGLAEMEQAIREGAAARERRGR